MTENNDVPDRQKDQLQEVSLNKDIELAISPIVPLNYSKNLQIGDTKLLVVDKEDDIISGEAPSCCVLGSPKHVAALKAKIEELKSNSEQLERERREALSRSDSVSKQLDRLVKELSQLGHDNNHKNNEQTIHATVHTFGSLQKLEIIADDEDSAEEYHKHDRLMRKPRVRQYWHAGTLHREAEERKVNFKELFWDLIFVAVIGNLGHVLVEDVTLVNIERFILTFYPIWRVWIDMTHYLNMYSSDDLLEKFIVFFEMVLVITMGTHASDIFDETAYIYLISFVIARMTFMLLNLLHATWIPLFRIPFINTSWGIFIPCMLWIVAIFVPRNRVMAVMWIALVFENLWTGGILLINRYGSEIFNRNKTTREEFETVDDSTLTLENTLVNDSSPTLTSPTSTSPTSTSPKKHAPHKAMKTRGTEYQWKWKDLFSLFRISEYRPALNIEHYSERLGLFTIIALGEGILGILYTSFNPSPDGQLAKAILGLLTAYNLHWIYFDVDASRQFQHALRRHTFTGILFGLIHFPMNMALIAFGTSLGRMVQLRDFPGSQHIPVEDNDLHLESRAVPEHADDAVFPSSLSWLYCISLAISLYCMAFIGMLHKGLDNADYLRIRKSYRILLRFIIGTIYLLLPLSKINSLNLIIITSMLSLLLVIVEIYGRLRKGLPLFGNCDDDVLDAHNKRYIRWRWGNKNSNKRTWSNGVLKKTVITNFNSEIPILSRYSIHSRVFTWDNKWFYLISYFRLHSTNEIASIALSKVIFKVSSGKTIKSEVMFETSGYFKNESIEEKEERENKRQIRLKLVEQIFPFEFSDGTCARDFLNEIKAKRNNNVQAKL
ncbi:894_t:CDS:10 [Funneliformis geosporum]|uniref:12033_t:CDS:1 n=1 Tax=Funneliformis geosporum TaxID=1117311 RepID=A0A9W4ST79_9GLOM|nr:12033_t:CDS:10 [Funneliformis geosporum]CAI2183765.1 894_t:CDS:10 [Funneliformis geosporum]